MDHYRFTESQDEKGNPIGTLEKQVTEGGQTSWQDDLKGYIPYDKEAEKDKEHDIAIADINSKIPEEASEENKLTDHNQVSEDIATSSATFRETYNLVSDLSLTTSATREQVAAALGMAISEADNNDFCYVEVPTADDKPTEITRTDRYKFNGTAWGFEFTINSLTAAQWDAVNSGITPAKVMKLDALPTNAEMEAESYFQKNFATIVALAADPNAGVTTVTDNPEWKIVYTDANYAILLGKRQDNTWYIATDLDTILDAIISGYNAS